MTYQLFVIVSAISNWLLLSLAMFVISDELGWQKKWKAWVPGLRFYSLGSSVGMNREGRYCGIIDVLYLIAAIVRIVLRRGQLSVFTALIHLVLFVIFFLYSIRIFMQILKLFGLSKKWIILWLVANWLPLFILGVGNKYQPKKEMIEDEPWEAGTEPVQIPDTVSATVPMAKDGLSVHIKERTVSDFGKKRYLLKDISLNIPKKSMVLLLGGSGSGKTTLVNALIGYEKADAEILLNGADVYKEYESMKYKIGFVPQQNLIRGKDTVIKTVSHAAELRLPKSVSKKERDEKIEDVMRLLGLTAGQEGLVSKKSGGQLRRICIAMELVTDPELFVLDEPDSGLDGVISREIFTKLRQIADEGRIVIVITHTPDRVIDLFDKVIVLARDSGKVGRLAFYGSPDEAREFFGKDTMEQIVMSVNGKAEGGEGRADELIEKYAAYAGERKEA